LNFFWLYSSSTSSGLHQATGPFAPVSRQLLHWLQWNSTLLPFHESFIGVWSFGSIWCAAQDDLLYHHPQRRILNQWDKARLEPIGIAVSRLQTRPASSRDHVEYCASCPVCDVTFNGHRISGVATAIFPEIAGLSAWTPCIEFWRSWNLQLTEIRQAGDDQGHSYLYSFLPLVAISVSVLPSCW
jgi:hypothetical protein